MYCVCNRNATRCNNVLMDTAHTTSVHQLPHIDAYATRCRSLHVLSDNATISDTQLALCLFAIHVYPLYRCNCKCQHSKIVYRARKTIASSVLPSIPYSVWPRRFIMTPMHDQCNSDCIYFKAVAVPCGLTCTYANDTPQHLTTYHIGVLNTWSNTATRVHVYTSGESRWIFHM